LILKEKSEEKKGRVLRRSLFAAAGFR